MQVEDAPLLVLPPLAAACGVALALLPSYSLVSCSGLSPTARSKLVEIAL